MLRERIAAEGLSADVFGVRDDSKWGLAGKVSAVGDADAVKGFLGEYAAAWELEDSR